MLLYLLPVLVTSFPRTFIIKGNTNNGTNTPSCQVPVIAFIREEAAGCSNEEAIGAINEAAIGDIISPRNLLSCSFFHFLLFQSHHQLIDLIFLVTIQF